METSQEHRSRVVQVIQLLITAHLIHNNSKRASTTGLES